MRRCERRRDGADGDAEDAGDRAVVEVGVVAEKDDEALPLRQLRDERRERLELRRRRVDERVGIGIDRQRPGVADDAARRVDDGAPEPRIEWAVTAERRTCADGARERIVHRLLGKRAVADYGVREPHEPRQIAMVEALDVVEDAVHPPSLIQNGPALLSVTQISEHVWWAAPGPPDRPSLCAVVGDRWTLALDAGSSRAHTHAFLDGLPQRPAAVVYTHSHWDHVFGGVESGGLVFAHRLTAAKLVEMAARDWTDDANVSQHIRQELPAPRVVEIATPDVVFDDAIDFDLGGVTVRVEHVGGDHCDDACVALVLPDGVLFLGDALCASPDGVMTAERALPLFDRVLAYEAARYVEGHHPQVTTRTELEELLDKARAAQRGARTPGDEDSQYFVDAFAAGRDLH